MSEQEEVPFLGIVFMTLAAILACVGLFTIGKIAWESFDSLATDYEVEQKISHAIDDHRHETMVQYDDLEKLRRELFILQFNLNDGKLPNGCPLDKPKCWEATK